MDVLTKLLLQLNHEILCCIFLMLLCDQIISVLPNLNKMGQITLVTETKLINTFGCELLKASLTTGEHVVLKIFEDVLIYYLSFNTYYFSSPWKRAE